MKMSFILMYSNIKTHVYKKGFAISLVLEVKGFGSRKRTYS